MDDLAISPEELAQITGGGSELATPEPIDIAQNIDQSFDTPNLPKEKKVSARPVDFAPLKPSGAVSSTNNLDLLLGVSLRVTVELGRTKMNIEEVLKLGPGSVVELDKLAGEPVDVLVNDRLIARGEVVVIDDRFGVRITDILSPVQRINSLQ
jgi:flagellar motor switch protein FliN/FliY